MRKSELLNLSNVELDKAVKIGGTDLDRRHKLKTKDIVKIKKLYSKGMLIRDIAAKFNVSSFAIRRHVDEDFRLADNEARKFRTNNGGYYYGMLDERANYKRRLIISGDIKASSIERV